MARCPETWMAPTLPRLAYCLPRATVLAPKRRLSVASSTSWVQAGKFIIGYESLGEALARSEWGSRGAA